VSQNHEVALQPVEGDKVDQIIELFPKYRKCVDKDGCMYTMMNKAMYGCIQASLIWFDLLIEV
jgi:hypothetical protein